ncbi:hypothetical protein O6H91_07G094700 [Diphasiastrum complanatum]|nr:hypothetical protein O6H91_07G094700 [Diphasiastrum complanatum]
MNANENSQDVWFTPGQLLTGDPQMLSYSEVTRHVADTKTAGSCSLLLQVCLPILLFAPNNSELVLKGGTNVSFSPPIDYTKHVLVPLIQKHFGVTVDIEIVRRGFMPRGGGIINVKIQPAKLLPPIHMVDRGIIVSITAKLYGFGNTDQQFMDSVKVSVANMLQENGIDVKVKFEYDMQGLETKSKLVCGLFLHAESSTGCIFGGGSLAGHNSKPERLVYLAIKDLVKQLSDGGCTDEYLQDQLIIFMVLATGVSEIMTGPITVHTETAIYFAHHMTNAKITVTPITGSLRNLIRCQGIGHTPQ